MIRQAHTYLAGALSGTALIGVAVVAFVLLVSLGALRDWPLAGIGGSGDDAAVSEGDSVAPPTTAAGGAGTGATGSSAAGAEPAREQGRGAGESTRQDVAVTGSPLSPISQAPGGDAPGSSPTGSDGGASSPASSASSGAGGGGGSGAQPGGGSAGGGSSQSTSGAVTGTVNDTVSGVDEALGGTGVTTVTETAVDGLAGPESTVGKTVDKATETVGGVLGGKP